MGVGEGAGQPTPDPSKRALGIARGESAGSRGSPCWGSSCEGLKGALWNILAYHLIPPLWASPPSPPSPPHTPLTHPSSRFNFWGYSTVNYFSPMGRFSAAVGQGAPARASCDEFKQLVKECHRRGIEVSRLGGGGGG